MQQDDQGLSQQQRWLQPQRRSSLARAAARPFFGRPPPARRASANAAPPPLPRLAPLCLLATPPRRDGRADSFPVAPPALRPCPNEPDTYPAPPVPVSERLALAFALPPPHLVTPNCFVHLHGPLAPSLVGRPAHNAMTCPPFASLLPAYRFFPCHSLVKTRPPQTGTAQAARVTALGGSGAGAHEGLAGARSSIPCAERHSHAPQGCSNPQRSPGRVQSAAAVPSSPPARHGELLGVQGNRRGCLESAGAQQREARERCLPGSAPGARQMPAVFEGRRSARWQARCAVRHRRRRRPPPSPPPPAPTLPQASGAAPSYHVLQYSYVPDILEKRGPYREAHLAGAAKMVRALGAACGLLQPCPPALTHLPLPPLPGLPPGGAEQAGDGGGAGGARGRRAVHLQVGAGRRGGARRRRAGAREPKFAAARPPPGT